MCAHEVRQGKKWAVRVVTVGVGGTGGRIASLVSTEDIEDVIALDADPNELELARGCDRLWITGVGGGGAPPDVSAASWESLGKQLEEAEVVFVAGAAGGATAGELACRVARLARGHGVVLVIGVMTLPFPTDSVASQRRAEANLVRMSGVFEAVTVLPTAHLCHGALNPRSDRFQLANEMASRAVKSFWVSCNVLQLFCLDLVDIVALIKATGIASMGLGRAQGENRAVKAVRRALKSSWLVDLDWSQVQAVYVNISALPDLELKEASEAAEHVASVVHPEADLVFASMVEPGLDAVGVAVMAFSLDFGSIGVPQVQGTGRREENAG